MFRVWTRILVAGAFLAIGCAARAAEATPEAQTTPPIEFSISGSLGLTFTDNVLASNANRLDDGYIPTFLRLMLKGKVSDVTYTLYARQFSESYFDVAADNTLGTAGLVLTRPFGIWTFGIQFDVKLFFDKFFANRTLTAYDFIGFMTRSIVFEDIGLVVVPRFAVNHRLADIATVERTWIDGQLALEKQLADKPWYLTSSVGLQFHWYRTAAGTVPQDIVPSATLGVKYKFNDNVSLITEVGFLGRSSNIAAREFSKWTVGPRLDFNFKF